MKLRSKDEIVIKLIKSIKEQYSYGWERSDIKAIEHVSKYEGWEEALSFVLSLDKKEEN